MSVDLQVVASNFILVPVCVFLSHIFHAEGARRPSEPFCKVIIENEQEDPTTPNKPPGAGGRRRSLVSSEPQHVTLIVFGIGMVNRTHLEADIGGLTMEAELKKIHGSFTLKEKMKGEAVVWTGVFFMCSQSCDGEGVMLEMLNPKLKVLCLFK